MTNLFSVDSSVLNINLITINRELSADDVDLVLVNPLPVDCCLDEVSVVLHASVKQHVLDEINRSFCVETSGTLYTKLPTLNSLLVARKGGKAKAISQFIHQQPIKGNYGTIIYEKRYNAAVDASRVAVANIRASVEKHAVQLINENVRSIVREQRELFKEKLKTLISEQNINSEWVDDQLNASEKIAVSVLEHDIELLEQQIKSLTSKRKMHMTSISNIKRGRVESWLKGECSTYGKQLLEDINGKGITSTQNL